MTVSACKVFHRICFNFILSACIIILISCGSRSRLPLTADDPSHSPDSLVKYNKEISQKEDGEIEDFVARYQWKMNRTTTGLRYMIYRHGTGPKAEKGRKATLEYTVRLITGDICYSSEKNGPKVFEIGHGGVESGLEEGILLLRVGDRAKFIVPSHLAFGLLGDQDKIPPKSTLIYDIELIKLN